MSSGDTKGGVLSALATREAWQGKALVVVAFLAFAGIWMVGAEFAIQLFGMEPRNLPRRLLFILFIAGALLALSWLINKRVLKLRITVASRDAEIETLVEGYPVPMWVYGREKRNFIAVNRAALKRFGYTGEEFLALGWSDIRSPEEAERVREFIRHPTSPDGVTDAGTWNYKAKGGEEFIAHVTLTETDFKGQPAEIVLAVDVSREFQAIVQLREQEELFAQLLGSMKDGVWIGSADRSRLLYVSPSVEEIYGYSAHEMKADPMLWLTTVVEDQRHAVGLEWDAFPRKGATECDYQIRRKNGETRWVNDRKRVIRGPDGTVIRIAGVVRDVTAAHQANAQVTAVNESLERKVAERTAQLVVANAQLASFSYMAAHDLKAPLRAIAGFSELALFSLKERNTEEAAQMLERVENSAASLSRLIDDLLHLSEVSVADLKRVHLDMTARCRSVLHELETRDPHRRVEVVVQEGLTAQADAGLISSLLNNLIGNAWKYSAKKKFACIEIGMLRDPEKGPVFFVKDNGAGFSMEDATQLFEPFKRFHAGGDFSGSGIGLAICKRIVTRHKGTIWADSAVDVGSTFFFTLQEKPSEPEKKAVEATRDTPYYELVYVSTAVPRDMTDEELDRILASARKRNLELGITGLLVYHRGEFVQILEGERATVERLFNDTVAKDPRHTNPSVCLARPIEKRSFQKWSMGFARIENLPSGDYLELDSYLAKGISELDFSKTSSVGHRLLLAIYKNMQASTNLR